MEAKEYLKGQLWLIKMIGKCPNIDNLTKHEIDELVKIMEDYLSGEILDYQNEQYIDKLHSDIEMLKSL